MNPFAFLGSSGASPALFTRAYFWVAVGAILFSTTFSYQFFTEDYGHYEFTRGFLEQGELQFGSYQTNGGFWFSVDRLDIKFFRPLAEITWYFDVWAFGPHPRLMRLHSLVWYVMWLAAVGRLLARTIPGRFSWLALALCALSACAICPASMEVGRHVMLASTLGCLTVLGHVAWRLDGKRAVRWGSMAALILAMLSSETVFAPLALLFSYETARLFVPAGEHAPQTFQGRLRDWLRGVWPFAIAGAAYLAWYVLGGYGTHGSAFYLDPFRHPWQAAVQIPIRIAQGFGGLVTQLSLEMIVYNGITAKSIILPYLKCVQAIGFIFLVAVAGLAAATVRRMRQDERQSLLFFAIGAIASTGVMALNNPTSRAMMIPLIATSGMLALIARHALPGGAPRKSVAGLLCIGIIVYFFVTGPIFWVVNTALLLRGSWVEREAACKPVMAGNQWVWVVYTDSPMPSSGARLVREFYRLPIPDHYTALTLVEKPHLIKRLDERTISIEVENGTFLDDFLALVFHSENNRFHPGDRSQMDGLSVTVIQVKDGLPAEAAFEFEKPLDSPDHRWMIFEHGELKDIQIPPKGAVLRVGH